METDKSLHFEKSLTSKLENLEIEKKPSTDSFLEKALKDARENFDKDTGANKPAQHRGSRITRRNSVKQGDTEPLGM